MISLPPVRPGCGCVGLVAARRRARRHGGPKPL